MNRDSRAGLMDRLGEISGDFVQEVEVCCDLAHPNLVALLGYATVPGLYLMQELMEGSSIDQQLYTERWRPTQNQVLKIALDTARGMAYLHTAFQETRGSTREESVDKPIIHRDLKSPNLLLRHPPPPRGEDLDARQIVAKISDVGLSRDKELEANTAAGTAMMTGCGSVLWMAPEILLGEKYNEKLDVFSYGMCLVELVHRNLPWHGSGVAQQQIPMRLTQGKRPEHQIRKAYPIKELIEECWDTDPHRRPDFPEVVQRLRKFLDQARSGKLPPERQSTSREIEEGDEEEEDEEIGGAE